MSIAVICEGCGRAAGEREVYCPACGRHLPGRELPEASDAAPAGWLVATGAHGEGGFFEPLPTSMAVRPRPSPPTETGPGWRVRESPRRTVAPPPPPPLRAEAPPVLDPAPVAVVRRPPLAALYIPLLALVLLSGGGAVALLVLHVLLHR